MYAPAPCGDMVLKLPSGMTAPICLRRVSVPLRGYGFEISRCIPVTEKQLKFPSPYGDSPILASPVATGEVASMRADGGACALRALLSLWIVYGLRPWRPLRHTACATSPALAGEAGDTLRPLAGIWF